MKTRFAALVFGFAMLWSLSFGASAQAVRALVLYDAPASGPYQKLGHAYAIMLRNLLGHWDTSVDLVPVQNYAAGQVESYDALFYVGAIYNNPLPAVLLGDMANTQKKVVWFKYNLWQYAWDSTYQFDARYGFSFLGLRGLNAAPSPAQPNPGFFDTVTYKTRDLVKFYSYDAGTGTVHADPDLGLTQIVDATRATAVVPIRNSVTSEQAPYVVRSGNFWYFADMPLSYIGPRDRYLALCDLLHDILGIATPASRRAMVRLEDVGALVDFTSMKTLVDYLRSRRIPFSVATIPFYRDPLGVYNNNVPMEIHLSAATNLRRSLNYAINRGGKIVMHGYTHQYESMRNRYTAVSGDDFEFWNAVDNRPVPLESSEAWAAGRLDAGIAELKANGYAPFAWEAPHYQSSPRSIRAAVSRFPTTYQRVVYYTSDLPDLNPTSDARDFAVGQFFPYIIQRDYYGQRVLPENLGNIEYDISHIDPTSNVVYTWQDLLLNAQNALVVRDGFASFFFHPFWLEPSIGTPGFADFQKLVQGITNLGYTWVDASTAR